MIRYGCRHGRQRQSAAHHTKVPSDFVNPSGGLTLWLISVSMQSIYIVLNQPTFPCSTLVCASFGLFFAPFLWTPWKALVLVQKHCYIFQIRSRYNVAIVGKVSSKFSHALPVSCANVLNDLVHIIAELPHSICESINLGLLPLCESLSVTPWDILLQLL